MKKLLPKNLCHLVDATADDAARYSMMGVRIKLGDEDYVAEATDGRMLVQVKGKYLAEMDEFPDVVPEVKGEATDAVIPVAALKAIAKRKFRFVPRPSLNSMAISIGQDEAVLVTTDLEQVVVERTRLVDGRFPATADVIKSSTKGAPHGGSVTLAPALMAKLLGVLNKLMEAPKKEKDWPSGWSPRLLWEVRGKNGAVVVKGVTALGQGITAILMPLT